ncbi:MAG: DnaJ domain-containing protein [Thermoanaerobaculia bacterium]
MDEDYYVILGVPGNATTKQIRTRFLELAKERHPDRFQGKEKAAAESSFQRLTEAFNVLSDPERRRRYDAERSAGPKAQGSEQEQVGKAYLQRGIQAYRERDFRAALENFDQATKYGAEDPRAWYHLALTLGRERRSLPRARAAILKACELRPMDADYWTAAGKIFADSGLTEQAEAYLRKALDWGGDEGEVEDALAALKSGRTTFLAQSK